MEKSVSFTGWAFSGGKVLEGRPVAAGFAEKLDECSLSGVGTNSGFGATGLETSGLSVMDVPAGAGSVTGIWANAMGETQNTMAAVSTRVFI